MLPQGNDGGENPTQPPAPPPVPTGNSVTLEEYKQTLTAFEQTKAELTRVKTELAGAQGYSTTATVERDKFKTQLAELSTTSQGQLAELQAQLETANKTLADTATKLTDYETKAQAATILNNARTKVEAFAKDNSLDALTKMFDDGLMPGVENMTDEALTEFLTKQATFLSTISQVTAKDVAAGQTPSAPAPAGNASKTLAQLGQDLQEATDKFGFGSKEYNSAYQAYENHARNT